MEILCVVSSIDPIRYSLEPDLPSYGEFDLIIDYTDALLKDLGPELMMLYAAYAGPPIARDAFIALTKPQVHVKIECGNPDDIHTRVRDEYAPILARGRERVATLG